MADDDRKTDDRETLGGEKWLQETWRAGVAGAVALGVGVLAVALIDSGDTRLAAVLDRVVLILLAYLLVYVAVSVVVFSRATPAAVRHWATRSGRGTRVQRYLLGTAPGPGFSIFISAAALFVAVLWLPRGAGHSELPTWARVAIGVGMIVVSWVAILIAFAVAYHADDALTDGQGLNFPGDKPSAQATDWSDYIYFSVAVSTTFGTTDVDVTSTQMRRTITVHGLIAFVFNTVILAAVVSALLP